MNTIARPFQLLYKIYISLFFALVMTTLYPFYIILLYKKERFRSAFVLMKMHAKVLMFGMGVYLKVKGRNNMILDGPFLICANHSSYVDIPCLYALFSKYFIFTGKKEIEKWPLFNIFYTSGMNVLVDRKSNAGAMKSFKQMMSVIDEGSPLAIFPEGTISKNAPKLTQFKTGAVMIAIQKQIPILPITFTTNWRRLQRSGLWKGSAGPGISEVIIHPAIATQGMTKNNLGQLQEKLRGIIDQPLVEKWGITDGKSG